MRAYLLTISVLAMFAASCDKDKSDSDGDTSAATGDQPSEDTADEASPDPKGKESPGSKKEPDGAGPKATKGPKEKGGKKPAPATDKPKPAGAQHCQATFEDGYWKVWASDETKPALPASGPAAANTCTDDTPSDLTGGSVDGKPAGSQRVLLKTSEGCYVPNGGGPVGPLLGACTGLTWRVPY